MNKQNIKLKLLNIFKKKILFKKIMIQIVKNMYNIQQIIMIALNMMKF